MCVAAAIAVEIAGSLGMVQARIANGGRSTQQLTLAVQQPHRKIAAVVAE